jgi:hypothetical protein
MKFDVPIPGPAWYISALALLITLAQSFGPRIRRLVTPLFTPLLIRPRMKYYRDVSDARFRVFDTR